MNTSFFGRATALAFAVVTSAAAFADKYDDRAVELTQKYLLVDTHIDVPYRIKNHWEDVTAATKKGEFDYPRAKAGGLDIPFMSIYVPAKVEAEGGAKALADSLIDGVEAMVFRAPEKFAKVASVAEMKAAQAQGKVGLALGIENGAPIEGKLDNLQHFYDRGVRYITLAHSKTNHISDSSYDLNRPWKGLSPFGAELVEAMNRLGVMVDISHVSDEAFYEVMEVTKVPVIASHSSLRHFVPGFERNMDDKMVKALGKNGGVLMLNFGSAFVSAEANAAGKAASKARSDFAKSLGAERNDPRVLAYKAAYEEKFPFPFASVEMVADHVDRIVKLAGIDSVGIGSDYDGVGDTLPLDLKDVSSYPNLVAELLRRGYKEKQIEKFLGGNLIRVLSEVEAYAAKSTQ